MTETHTLAPFIGPPREPFSRTLLARECGHRAWLAYHPHMTPTQCDYLAGHRLLSRSWVSESEARADVDNYLRVCGEELKARHCGYSVEDLTFYTIDVLRVLVDAAMSGYVPAQDDEKATPGDPAEGGNMVAAIADVKRAIFYVMPASDRATVILYHAGVVADEDEYTRALVALQSALGGPRPRGL